LKKKSRFLLSAASGLLLFAAWPVSPLTFLIFFAFVPLLWMERQGIRRAAFFGWVYLAMLIWNVGATWWVWNASPAAIGAFTANSLLMCLPWLGFHYLRPRMGDIIGYASLIVFWLSFEYLHLQNWGLSWPWLTLGNVFASRTSWVQWYCYTGTSGGGLWVLVVNVLLFRWLWKAVQKKEYDAWRAARIVLLIAFPIFCSALYANSWIDDSLPHSPFNARLHPEVARNVVIVQPNIDPNEKISTGSFDAQLARLIRLSDSRIDSNTVLVVWPETALFEEHGFEEDHLKQNYFLRPLWAFLQRHPHINLLTGIEGLRVFNNKHSATAVKISNTNLYVESYNEAVLMDSAGPEVFPIFEKFGATEDGYTDQPDRAPIRTTNHYYTIAPSICYESIYGEFMAEYAHNGADLIAVITNDGWWGNTPGYRQHVSYARLRAIETRRWVIQCANTGMSALIAPSGKIMDSRPWWVPAVMKASVPKETSLTFYAAYGDIVSKLALGLTLLFWIWYFITLIKRRRSNG
jgi:apolipoprotein N-acyltransferase